MKEIVVNDKFLEFKSLAKGEMAIVLNQQPLNILVEDEHSIISRCSLKNKKQLNVEILTGEDEVHYYTFPFNEKFVEFVEREQIHTIKLFIKEIDEKEMSQNTKVKLCFSGYFQL